jgi:patatin-like phospholipase/acyl hydrolase
MTKRIFSMDGGGVLSLLTLRIIQRIEHQLPGFLNGIDLFAGTSAGGVNALLMAACARPYDAIHKAWDAWSATDGVYDSSLLRKALSANGLVATTSNERLEQVLRRHLGNSTLADLSHGVVCLSYDIKGRGADSYHPRIFSSLSGFDRGRSAVQVGLATTAFPAAFPVYDGYVDGGVYANNPCAVALAEFIRHQTRSSTDQPSVTAAQERKLRSELIGDVLVLSLGTGLTRARIDETNADWGYGQWFLDPRQPARFVDIVYAGTEQVQTFIADHLLGSSFMRFNPALVQHVERHSEFELHSPIDRLREIAIESADRAELGPLLEWLVDSGWVEAESEPKEARSSRNDRFVEPPLGE